jgi:enoyl-CoA hydratase
MMSPYQFLEIEPAEAGVTVIYMHRPPVNAIDQTMYREIYQCFSRSEALGAETRCIILTGRGKHFCAGNDLEEFAGMTSDNGVERMWRVREAFFSIQFCQIPVIGAVQGAALGSGLALAASCDFIIAAANARFGLPELTVGVFGGARHLARLAPQPLVRRMFFTSEQVEADEFRAAGASISVCEPARLLEEARKLATRIASFSPVAVRRAKTVLNRIETMDVRRGYELEQASTVEMSDHPHAKEALAAFRERRAPVFRPL